MLFALRIAIWFVLGAPAALAAEVKLWAGGPTPALELRDIEGRRHRLADYRGKVVLVNFWATWCLPCREELPALQRLKAKLAGKPFVVLAVNVDEPKARVREFLSGSSIDFAILMDPGKRAVTAWNVRMLPASFLIGTNGRVRYVVTGELDWSHGTVVSWVSELLPASR